MRQCMRCWISGRVQGVWYRASTRDQALSLNIEGYAKNLSDGRVEVLACGDDYSLDALKQWLRQGPPGSVVNGVSCKKVEEGEPVSGFFTL